MTEQQDRNKKTQPDQPVSTAALRRLVAGDPEKWTPHFTRLLDDIMAIDLSDDLSAADVQSDADLDCATCQDNLDLYLTTELEDSAVNAIYPAVWHHLQRCVQCEQAYLHLKEMLTVQPHDLPTGAMPTLSPGQLPFLSPPDKQSPWITRLQSQLAGAAFNLSVEFKLDYLRTLFIAPSFSPARSEANAAPPEAQLLLHQPIMIGHQAVTLDVVYYHPEAVDQPDKLTLVATLVNPGALPPHLVAHLTWAGQTYTAPLTPGGQVNFTDLSLAAIKEALETGAGSFSLTLREQATGVER